MKKYLFIVAVLIITALTSCGNGTSQSKTSQIKAIQDNHTEVLYFHGKQRCITCKAIETLTKEVLKADFATELESGEIVFKAIDISLKENEAIVNKYEVAFSSLILDNNGILVNLTDMGFSYAKGQPEEFKTQLKKELFKLLK
ncbi:MAG: nitrophenyl compound nitroreductase subunit ArsF family protein [Bacteroidales bacterium]